MNEQIKKIMEETGLYIAYENRAVTEKELAFFAEEIIRQCGIIADEYRDEQYVTKPSTAMKFHFGVKE